MWLWTVKSSLCSGSFCSSGEIVHWVLINRTLFHITSRWLKESLVARTCRMLADAEILAVGAGGVVPGAHHVRMIIIIHVGTELHGVLFKRLPCKSRGKRETLRLSGSWAEMVRNVQLMLLYVKPSEHMAHGRWNKNSIKKKKSFVHLKMKTYTTHMTFVLSSRK